MDRLLLLTSMISVYALSFDRIEGSNRQVLLSIFTNLFYRWIYSSLIVDNQFSLKDIRIWEREEFYVWSMTGHLLEHYRNNGYNTFLEFHLDVCNFAKLADLHFHQRMYLKFDTNLLLFWFTFWLMDKVTKLSSVHFPFVSKIIEAKITWSGVSNSHELNASTTMKVFTNSFFDFSTNLFHFFLPQLFPKFSTSTTTIKVWVTPFPRQNKYR